MCERKRKNQYSERTIISSGEFNHVNWDNSVINLREDRVKSACKSCILVKCSSKYNGNIVKYVCIDIRRIMRYKYTHCINIFSIVLESNEGIR